MAIIHWTAGSRRPLPWPPLSPRSEAPCTRPRPTGAPVENIGRRPQTPLRRVTPLPPPAAGSATKRRRRPRSGLPGSTRRARPHPPTPPPLRAGRRGRGVFRAPRPHRRRGGGALAGLRAAPGARPRPPAGVRKQTTKARRKERPTEGHCLHYVSKVLTDPRPRPRPRLGRASRSGGDGEGRILAKSGRAGGVGLPRRGLPEPLPLPRRQRSPRSPKTCAPSQTKR